MMTINEINVALQRSWLSQALPPVLEREFDTSREVSWRRQIVTFVVVLSVMSVAGLGVDARAGILPLAIDLKASVLLPVFGICLAFLYLVPPAGPRRWFALLTPTLATIAVVSFMAASTVPPFVDRYLNVAGLVGLAANLVLPLKLREAALLCLLDLTVYIGLATILLDANQLLLSSDILGFMSAAMIVSLKRVQHQERIEKDEFLLRWRDQVRTNELSELVLDLTRLAHQDGLTGGGNRRSFDMRYKAAWQTAMASREELTLAIIDVDHFKAFNDTAGHPAGDACLRAIAAAIAAGAGCPLDAVLRYGGEEFVLLLSVGRFDDAEKVRKAVADLALPHPGLGPAGRVTVSIGVASAFPADHGATPEGLLAAADDALYAAKRSGRNRVFQHDLPIAA